MKREFPMLCLLVVLGATAQAEELRSSVVEPGKITTLPGFQVELVYKVPKESEGSWVSLTVDPKGRFYASDQAKAGLFQVTVSEKPDGPRASVRRVEVKYPEKEEFISGAQGLQFVEGDLFFHKNGGNLYRLSDQDNDGELDRAEVLSGETGGGEHGNHDVIATEDRSGLYLVGGNHAPLASFTRCAVQGWGEDQLLPRFWDARGHARGRLAPGGWVTRFDPGTKSQEVISTGYRNPYGLSLNNQGELFTFDADMEWDLGSPWYRPTRICHVVSGSDYGWRSGTGKWPSYFEDSLPPVVEIGPGCPTGLIPGTGARFPERYREAIFALDWTFGTMYAIHLEEQGAGYSGEAEPFLYGAPLPLTDAVVGKDGMLYFLVGGRGTQSAMYRVKHDGLNDDPAIPGDPEAPRAREIRRMLEAFHGIENEAAVSLAWPYLSEGDRFLRHAARVAVESQPVHTWVNRLWAESNPQAVITGSVALARSGSGELQGQLVDKLLALPAGSLKESQQLGWLRAFSLAFIRLGGPTPIQRARALAILDPMLPSDSPDVDRELLKMLVYLKASTAIEKGIELITKRSGPDVPDWYEIASRNERYGRTIQALLDNHPPTQQIGYALMLSNLAEGWTMQQRREYFTFLNEAAKGAGGASFPGFLAQIRTQALAGCSDEERAALTDLTGENFNPVPDFDIRPPKGPGKSWKLDEAVSEASQKGAHFENGRNLYFAVGCGSCHRLGGLGGGVGPDLSTIPAKFDSRYVLDAIINPSKDISDQYGSSVITTTRGKVYHGIAVQHEDRLEVYPPDAKSKPVVLAPDSVKSIKESTVSQMPPGLLNRLNKEELRDLVAYLMSGGNPNGRLFKK